MRTFSRNMSDSRVTFTLREGGEKFIVEPSWLLVFVDETGEEHFSDKSHPVFGLGGCAVLAANYEATISKPWRELKEKRFAGANVPLHANELRSPTAAQVAALADFFSSDQFSRFAAIASSKAGFPDSVTPYQIVARAMLGRIERIALKYRFTGVALMLEANDRSDSLAERHFGPYDKMRVQQERLCMEYPIRHFLAPKSLQEPGLEVADFIMHAVGGQARSHADDRERAFRKDFAAIFHSVPPDAVDYIDIAKIEVRDA